MGIHLGYACGVWVWGEGGVRYKEPGFYVGGSPGGSRGGPRGVQGGSGGHPPEGGVPPPIQ